MIKEIIINNESNLSTIDFKIPVELQGDFKTTILSKAVFILPTAFSKAICSKQGAFLLCGKV